MGYYDCFSAGMKVDPSLMLDFAVWMAVVSLPASLLIHKILRWEDRA